MPMPQEYQRAGEAFDAFLRDAMDELGHTTRNQAYTTVQGVLRAFRDRLTVEEGVRFAGVLPPVLRALFVADWPVDAVPTPFGTRAAMTREVQSVRSEHNFAPDSAIADVSRALRRHVDAPRFDAVLRSLPDGAEAFWSARGGC